MSDPFNRDADESTEPEATVPPAAPADGGHLASEPVVDEGTPEQPAAHETPAANAPSAASKAPWSPAAGDDPAADVYTVHPQAATTAASPAQPGDSFHRPTHRRSHSPLIVGALVAGLIAGALGGVGASAIFYGSTSNNSSTSQSDSGSTTSNSGTSSTDTSIKTTKTLTASELSKVINSKLASVVTVGVVGSSESGTGSGVVLNSSGYIVTNAHVATLEGTTANGAITVQTSTGNIYTAKLVGYDSTADVAVLKIASNAVGISPITFADSDAITVGSTAVVIGAPLGLSGTVTTGIVSALNRPITVASSDVSGNSSSQSSSGGTSSYVALSAIQTDAAINQGNSGGALLDQNGNLLGLNDAIATSGDSTGSIGIGFAIPGNYVKRVAQEIISNGSAEHGYLGASLTDYSASETSFTSGAKITRTVTGGAAVKAGLETGDVITKIDDTVIESSTQATAIIKEDMPGDKISLTYTRNGTAHTISITLGSTATQS